MATPGLRPVLLKLTILNADANPWWILKEVCAFWGSSILYLQCKLWAGMKGPDGLDDDEVSTVNLTGGTKYLEPDEVRPASTIHRFRFNTSRSSTSPSCIPWL
jgi:hypothetical protein